VTASNSEPEDLPEGCLLCTAEHITPRLLEDDELWVADCMVCATPMIVWRTHGLPDEETEQRLLNTLRRVGGERYGAHGYWIDSERRRIPDHWHAHARPAGAFFDPASDLAKTWTDEDTEEPRSRRPEARFPDR
jgi:hypothetical protein